MIFIIGFAFLNMADERISKILKALADPNRLRILEIIGDREVCACKFLEWMDISQPTLSHHLRVLSDAELIVGRKEMQWIHYSLNRAALELVSGYLSDLNKPCMISDIQ